MPTGVCGDGVIDEGEMCDDGNVVGGDSCDADCSAWHCTVPQTHGSLGEALADDACTTIYLQPQTHPAAVSLDRDVSIVALGPGAILDGGGRDTTLRVPAGVTVELRGVDVTGGVATRGGGIDAQGHVSLIDVRVYGNQARGVTPMGAGIASTTGSLTLEGSEVHDNLLVAELREGTAYGAGVYCSECSLTLHESTSIHANRIEGIGDGQVGGAGIAILNTSFAKLDEVVIDGNSIEQHVSLGAHASGAGAVLIASAAELTNVSIRDNGVSCSCSASGCGAVIHGGGLTLRGAVADVRGSAISDNVAQADAASGGVAVSTGAGAMVFSGGLTLRETTVSSNRVAVISQGRGYAWGAGVYASVNDESTTLTLLDAIVADNVASASLPACLEPPCYPAAFGAGISVYAHLNLAQDIDIRRTTIMSNHAEADDQEAAGGALALFADADGFIDTAMLNSTLAGNTVASGDVARGSAVVAQAADGEARVDLRSCTVADDSADASGARQLAVTTQGVGMATFRATHTIFSGSGEVSDCSDPSFTVESLGHNLFSNQPQSCFTLDDTDLFVAPLLGAIGDHGGYSPTLPLLPNSPALDAGLADCAQNDGSPLTTDQRLEPRPNGARCDIGAFEL